MQLMEETQSAMQKMEDSLDLVVVYDTERHKYNTFLRKVFKVYE